MSRLFWFALGGASAFWWVRKHDEEKFARFSGKIGGEEGRNGWNCMKHSWGRRAELQDRQRDALAENQIDKDVELWKQETKEKLSRAVETGLDNVIGVLAHLEAAYNERNRWTPPVPSARIETIQDTPVATSVSEAPAIPKLTPVRAPSPLIPQQTPTDAQVLTQVLAAIEKLNARIDSQQRPSEVKEITRLV